MNTKGLGLHWIFTRECRSSHEWLRETRRQAIGVTHWSCRFVWRARQRKPFVKWVVTWSWRPWCLQECRPSTREHTCRITPGSLSSDNTCNLTYTIQTTPLHPGHSYFHTSFLSLSKCLEYWTTSCQKCPATSTRPVSSVVRSQPGLH